MPDQLDWKTSSSGLQSVSSQLKEIFSMHLGRVVAKVFPVAIEVDVDGLSSCNEILHPQ
jgi:hypothetical protein